MTLTIRPAERPDLDQLTDLLMTDAEQRCAADPGLWKLDPSAQDKIRSAITTGLEPSQGNVRHRWLIAETGGMAVGVTHSMLLAAPPIYAGEFGPPGLIMEDCCTAPGAPPKARHDLFKAAEADLIAAGALILLATSVTGGAWEGEYAKQGYVPLTTYFAKTGLTRQADLPHVRSATADDVPAIVAASAVHRRILDDLHHQFWKPHAEADTRFGAWMKRSLTLPDRDMFVSDDDGIRGYAISQPATSTHFPPPHDISGVGVIDDFYHEAIEDPQTLGEAGVTAAALFSAAEAARAHRGDHSVLVVCPANWSSKIQVLEQLGYRNAITWHIKMVS